MPDRPNILLVTTDQQRFDTIHRAGNRSILTPHLDWLCDTGIQFRRCYSDAPICVAARASIMTGRHGYRNGLTTNNGSPIPMAEHPTLPGLLTGAGYQTRAVGKMHFYPPRGHYGFEHMEILQDYYRQVSADDGLSRPMDHGVGQNEMVPVMSTIEESRSLTRWTVDRSVDFLETRDDTRPFFLWTSFSKPHPPWDCDPKYWALYENITMPDPVYGDWSQRPEDVPGSLRDPTFALNQVHAFSDEQLRAARRAYYACISQIDYNLGYLFARLRELELQENTWIIFASDHGEMLGDHWLGAKCVFLEGSAHVPMIVRPASSDWLPTEDCGQVCDELVCLADLLPTCTNVAGAETPTDIDGIDLVSVCRGDARREILLGQQHEFFASIDDRYKYHFAAADGAELLFDLQDDPYEQKDLIRAGGHEDALARLRGEVAGLLREHLPDAEREGRPVSLLPPGQQLQPGRVRWPGLHTRGEQADVLH